METEDKQHRIEEILLQLQIYREQVEMYETLILQLEEDKHTMEEK